jgi:hypothetical protein
MKQPTHQPPFGGNEKLHLRPIAWHLYYPTVSPQLATPMYSPKFPLKLNGAGHKAVRRRWKSFAAQQDFTFEISDASISTSQ